MKFVDFFFPRLSCIASLSLLIWLFFYYITEVHSWRRNYDQGQNPVWLRRCAMHQCDTPIIPFFALGLCAVRIVWVPSIAQRHIWCDLKLIYFVRSARKTRFFTCYFVYAFKKVSEKNNAFPFLGLWPCLASWTQLWSWFALWDCWHLRDSVWRTAMFFCSTRHLLSMRRYTQLWLT